MAKRFTDTNKYKKPFFRSLQGPYKLLFDYLYHECDHAGIWIVDFEIAQIYLGKDMIVSKNLALHFFNTEEEKIIEIDGGKKWFIPSFIDFQYGVLNEENRAHKSVISILKSYGIEITDKGLKRSLQGRKDMDKDKVVHDKNKLVGIDEKNSFETFWDLYDKKVGDRTKIEKKFEALSERVKNLIFEYLPKYIQSQPDKKYRKNPDTFLNNKSWNDEIIPSSPQTISKAESAINVHDAVKRMLDVEEGVNNG